MEFLPRHVEALIFSSPEPLSIDAIGSCLSEMFDAEVPSVDIAQAIEGLLSRYTSNDYAFELVHLAGGYEFMTKPAYRASISLLLKQQAKKRLSRSALETLAIIAYKQPITKPLVEQIRGVNCDYAIKKLLEKELLEIKGKSDGIGKPLLYGTTQKFLAYFGINSIEDLPLPKDFAEEANEIGQQED